MPAKFVAILRLAAATLAVLLPGLASAQSVELGFYGGYQTSPHSGVEIAGDSVIADTEFTAGWEGRSFDAPPYYGLRATWWRSESFGVGLDFNHAKVYADDETLAETGFERLEFSDGINILTVNVYRRWPNAMGEVTPYIGGGVGVSVPHVELTETGPGGTSETFEYQMTGPAVALIAGVSYPVTDDLSVFGEYKGTYSQNEAELDTGGTLSTDIVTNALNVGVSFNF